MRQRSNKRSKACEISQEVKKAVWERDGGLCVFCGNGYNVMPNAHYIPRSDGGLGIEENVVTLCAELTDNKCHRRYDFGSYEERERIGTVIREYLQAQYPDWDEKKLRFDKWGWMNDV